MHNYAVSSEQCCVNHDSCTFLNRVYANSGTGPIPPLTVCLNNSKRGETCFQKTLTSPKRLLA